MTNPANLPHTNKVQRSQVPAPSPTDASPIEGQEEIHRLQAQLAQKDALLREWERKNQNQAEENLEIQIQLEEAQRLNQELEGRLATQADQLHHLNELQAQLTPLTQQLDTWKLRALTAENRLLNYAPLDRQLLETQQQLIQLQQALTQEQKAHRQAQERIIVLERHILQLKSILNLSPNDKPAPIQPAQDRFLAPEKVISVQPAQDRPPVSEKVIPLRPPKSIPTKVVRDLGVDLPPFLKG